MVIELLGPLTEPLHYAFFVRALAAAMMVGVVCAIVGSFVVLRGMAFLGDALAHAILPGVALGYLAGGGGRGPMLWWGLATAALTALAIGAVSRRTEIREDTAIGIVFAGMFALGIALISSQSSFAVDLTHILFGDILGVGRSDLLLILILGGAVIATVVLLFKELVLITFDPVLADTLRLPAARLYYLLLLLIAVTTVVSLQTVGVGLVVAMLVTPAATASLFAKRLPTMMAIAASVGALSGVVGLYASYYLGIASGASIVLVCTIIFVAAFFLAPEKGWLWRRPGRAGGHR